eukprot:TRINITY_DN22123_c0_g1_i1.p3 TRINITY_DN22123_c0_g1~~TRINITY_DN22123_c0_g1_i1.p3  ORF type:complete len:118 (+),score=3.15 TRINITY_DN22123_c0_g1_i1:323-676(+)
MDVDDATPAFAAAAAVVAPVAEDLATPGTAGVRKDGNAIVGETAERLAERSAKPLSQELESLRRLDDEGKQSFSGLTADAEEDAGASCLCWTAEDEAGAVHLISASATLEDPGEELD